MKDTNPKPKPPKPEPPKPRPKKVRGERFVGRYRRAQGNRRLNRDSH